MKPEEFERLANLLKRRSGLVITPDKGYLVESRLAPVAQKHGLKDLAGLLTALAHGDENLAKAVTEAMTTNETSWFRDNTPFDIFRKDLLPEMLERRGASKCLRIWSAAASTGQEAYSLAMILRDDAARLANWKIEIVGTDISEAALAQAQSGAYSHFEVQRGLPAQMLIKHFEKTDGVWRINQLLRSMVRFRHFNLLDNLSTLGSFDIIFCRNVLIYFDVETKARALNAMAGRLNPHGAIVLGGAETVLGITDKLEPFPNRRGVYRVVDKAAQPLPKMAPALATARVAAA